MKIALSFFTSSVLALLVAGACADNTESVRVARDATVAFNGIMCDNDIPCSSIPHGMEDKLLSFRGNRDYERILLGFDLPAGETAKSCVLRIPPPLEIPGDSYELTVATTDNNWEEATVNGKTKSLDGERIGSVSGTNGQGTSVDITEACKKATDGKLSLFVDTARQMVTFNSIQSGSSDIFSIDFTH
ncbi:hypothetical protein COEREDRAFT_82613 [Coemansia reversa NRRL 1564]|uniref:Carbohydrate-binding module family 96 domain-containing protein n=1 Tax=Coemansia reversa (strain ATCC 12441 / NRRL 1564) TaxID=763665 RepID=A0A2G5B771_COERN|nr:hypothetical protein COEREDRAFT_82613 [Coemansia reversa NRRL 1564]|eukprot:PIA14577.1 hypothetical protein COEREDRAFT_82613 [Coemansia reversa NRRL 1564]